MHSLQYGLLLLTLCHVNADMCAYYNKQECTLSGCKWSDTEKPRCWLPKPTAILKEFTFPYTVGVVGEPGSGKSTFLNAVMDALGHGRPFPEGVGAGRQSTQIRGVDLKSGLRLLDVPGLQFKSMKQNDAKFLALVSGVADLEPVLRKPHTEWKRDPTNAIHRFIVVLSVEEAVIPGWVYNSVDDLVIADWRLAMDVLDQGGNYSPIIVLNTFGYNPMTVNKVKERIKAMFSRVQTNAFFAFDCRPMREEEVAKVLYGILIQAKAQQATYTPSS